MKRNGNIVSYTSEELAEMRARGEFKIDWAKFDAITNEEWESLIAADPDEDYGRIEWGSPIKGLPSCFYEATGIKDPNADTVPPPG
jgi:hypothetical protein